MLYAVGSLFTPRAETGGAEHNCIVQYQESIVIQILKLGPLALGNAGLVCVITIYNSVSMPSPIGRTYRWLNTPLSWANGRDRTQYAMGHI